ncbi:MAG TPA: tRNA uridine-5-carboxymethylaminomethyl(34) synthesis GTPase MnmE [Bacteroidia bacterium]|nr:tRNA uridine-5-carboxymethylaminomethyl(34) synthesis GTPase MnmE [Bacteroidia bacterium]
MNQLDPTSTICAPATAPGIGAISVIRVSGAEALNLVTAVFKGHKLNVVPSHTVHFGKITDGEKVIDEVLATVFVAPASYTGEHTVEISCHGSTFIQQRILELLVRQGARMAQPGEFTLRAFLNKKLDLSQAEAVADLISADSEASLQTALKQMRGGYSTFIQRMREELIGFASLIELELDFSEEDVEFANRAQLLQLLHNVQQLIQSLIDSFQYGNAIKNGVPTVIAGKPNAGKSTLLNSLLKEDRAIVSNIEGTTRDTIEERLVVDGLVFRLIDTAGIRQAESMIEAAGIERTLEKLKQAEIILYLFDVNTTTPETLQAELNALPPAKVLAIGNKIDLSAEKDIQNKWKDIQVPFLFISANNEEHIGQLLTTLKNLVATAEHAPNQVVITNLRHYQALLNATASLQQVQNALTSGISGELVAFDIRKAIYHLGEITGEITTDDLLESIFSKFCIGK